MKRTFVGVFVLGTMVAVGSAAVYFAQKKLSPPPPGPDAQLLAERLPEAIPIGSASHDGMAPADDPYAQPVARVVAQRDAEDRYGSRPGMIPQDTGAEEIPSATQMAEEEPSEALPAARSVSPFARRTAVDQVPAEEPFEAEALDNEMPAEDSAAFPAARPTRYEAPVEPEELAEEAEEDPVGEPEPVEHEPIADEPAGGTQPEVLPAEGTGRPGDPQLSGSQAPTLTIEKVAPPEIQIGKPAKFLIKVRNAGGVIAHGVEIHDAVPQGTQLLDTVPPAKRMDDGKLIWELGSLKPGDEQSCEMQLMPTAEGEIGSVATVHFRAEASVRTLATKPMLAMEVLGPSKVNKGEEITLRIKLSNPGSGAAHGVVLTETVPDGLTHAAGKELEFEVGTLKPGESKELDLTMIASEAGKVVNLVTAEGEASLKAEAETEVEIVAPQLQVALTGPKRRYLERNATHNISISNPGTAAAKDVELAAVLPRTLKFVSANNGGQFDEATHTVYWSLEELPPQETGTVTLTTLPLEPGDAKLLIKSTTKTGLKDEREEVVAIEGLAAINFQLNDVHDPIEMGGETAYEIRVTNQGSKASTNVRLAALVPRGMKPVSAEGPVRYKIEGQRVVFEPLKQLAAKADTTFTLKVKAVASGDQRVQVQITTDEIRDPITKEESTRVFGDE